MLLGFTEPAPHWMRQDELRATKTLGYEGNSSIQMRILHLSYAAASSPTFGDGRPLLFFCCTTAPASTRGVPSLRPASSSLAKFLKRPFTPISCCFFLLFLSWAYRFMRMLSCSLFQYQKITINVLIS